MKEFHYSADEAGMEMIARAVVHNGLVCVLQVVKDEDGYYYYGVFADYYKSGIFDSKQAFMKFLDDNETSGYSTGGFNSLEELNNAMKRDGCTAYGFIEGGI